MDYLFYEYVCFHEIVSKLLTVKPAAVDRSQHLKLKLKLSGSPIHTKLSLLFIRVVCFLVYYYYSAYMGNKCYTVSS